MFFDDESAEVVISSLRLGEEQDRCVEPGFVFCSLVDGAGTLCRVHRWARGEVVIFLL